MRLLLVFLIFFSQILWADQLIIEPEMGRQPLLDAINSSHHSIDLVMYGFTDKSLRDAIIHKKNSGNTVKIILEDHPYQSENENAKTIAIFNANQVAWQGNIPPYRLVHQKTLILDNKKAIVMTFNFTHSTFRNQRNFGLIIDDKKRVNAIHSLFIADWNHVESDIDSQDLIISPENSRARLLALIDGAKSSIRIYAQGINDYKIIGALAKAGRRSVKVDIITSAVMSEGKQNYLSRAGVNLHFCKHLIIHAKVIEVDNKIAAIGSINLTRSSLDDNRELSVLTNQADVLQLLNKTFDRDLESC